jgi:hypothetical protein
MVARPCKLCCGYVDITVLRLGNRSIPVAEEHGRCKLWIMMMVMVTLERISASLK